MAPTSVQHPPQVTTTFLGGESPKDWRPASDHASRANYSQGDVRPQPNPLSPCGEGLGLCQVSSQQRREADLCTGLGPGSFLTASPLSRGTGSSQRLNPPHPFHSRPEQRLHEVAH
ncbi:Hypothetical predicted protein [Pelobates cultripes]|uniref:Uncharacterized protein n=1 Tax=Pelobates cultripes TaxID=61616 RepID=A0AAD1S998_PELCU|nr:Hypothetical predicted protein [Pelobates cultripes]